jgi:hypothetical protein
MPIGKRPTENVYAQYIRPVLAESGLRPMNADECHGREIMEDIWTKLNEARLVVADLTGQNPNVMYELGIAHALGKPTVLLSADPASSIPFDIRGFRHILYRRSPTAKIKALQRGLRKHVREILAENPSGDNMVRYLTESAETWVSRYHDSLALAPEGFLNLARQHVDVKFLSPKGIAFCAATAAHYGSVDNMIHYGRYCSNVPEAAQELAFMLIKSHRRPKYRVARMIEQFQPKAKSRAIRTIVQQGGRVRVRGSHGILRPTFPLIP